MEDSSSGKPILRACRNRKQGRSERAQTEFTRAGLRTQNAVCARWALALPWVQRSCVNFGWMIWKNTADLYESPSFSSSHKQAHTAGVIVCYVTYFWGVITHVQPRGCRAAPKLNFSQQSDWSELSPTHSTQRVYSF